jgi:hypothetical protein
VSAAGVARNGGFEGAAGTLLDDGFVGAAGAMLDEGLDAAPAAVPVDAGPGATALSSSFDPVCATSRGASADLSSLLSDMLVAALHRLAERFARDHY